METLWLYFQIFMLAFLAISTPFLVWYGFDQRDEAKWLEGRLRYYRFELPREEARLQEMRKKNAT